MIKRVRLSTVVLAVVLAVTTVAYFTLPRPSPPEDRRDDQGRLLPQDQVEDEGRPLPREAVEEEPEADDVPTTETTAPEAVPDGEEPTTPEPSSKPEPGGAPEDPDDPPSDPTTTTTTPTAPPANDGGTGVGPDESETTIPAA